MGISTPNMSLGVTPKFPTVSTTSGKILCGRFNILMNQSSHCIVNGSNIPVAEAHEISITCFPAINKQDIAISLLCEI